VVVVNLYPFYDKVTSGNISFEDGIENIDIGGPTMIRAAAKVTKYFCSWHHLPCNSHYMIAVFFFFCIWDIYCNGNSDIHGWCTLTMDDSVKVIALCSDRTIRMFLLWWIIMIILLYWSTLKESETISSSPGCWHGKPCSMSPLMILQCQNGCGSNQIKVVFQQQTE
jgi:hypothetical protein